MIVRKKLFDLRIDFDGRATEESFGSENVNLPESDNTRYSVSKAFNFT